MSAVNERYDLCEKTRNSDKCTPVEHTFAPFPRYKRAVSGRPLLWRFVPSGRSSDTSRVWI
jgi:hypothetical protein